LVDQLAGSVLVESSSSSRWPTTQSSSIQQASQLCLQLECTDGIAVLA
jgi:hypothetical protein